MIEIETRPLTVEERELLCESICRPYREAGIWAALGLIFFTNLVVILVPFLDPPARGYAAGVLLAWMVLVAFGRWTCAPFLRAVRDGSYDLGDAQVLCCEVEGPAAMVTLPGAPEESGVYVARIGDLPMTTQHRLPAPWRRHWAVAEDRTYCLSVGRGRLLLLHAWLHPPLALSGAELLHRRFELVTANGRHISYRGEGEIVEIEEVESALSLPRQARIAVVTAPDLLVFDGRIETWVDDLTAHLERSRGAGG